MKKLSLLALILLVVLLAIACTAKPASVDAQPVEATATVAPTPTPTPTPSPTPTPVPLTDVIYDKDDVTIRYEGHQNFEELSLYLFSVLNKRGEDIVVIPGKAQLEEDGNIRIGTPFFTMNNEKCAIISANMENYHYVPADAQANLVFFVYNSSLNEPIDIETPEQMSAQFTVLSVGDESLSLTFDTDVIEFDFDRIASTKQLIAERRQKAEDEGGYTGIMFSGIDLDGNTVDDSIIAENKFTVLNFWATWCGPCKQEIPAFSKVAAEYADKGVGFLGVQTDENIETAKEIWDKSQVVYPSIFATGDLQVLSLGQDSIPVTIIVDQNGRQCGEAHVGSMTQKQLTEKIEAALNAWTKTYTFEEKYDVTLSYAGGDTLTITLTDPDLKEKYTINKASTNDNYKEYGWTVKLTDGVTEFLVSTSQFKFPGAEEMEITIDQMQSDLWLSGKSSNSRLTDAKLAVNGKQLQWSVSIPKKYGFDFENAEVTEANIMHAVG